MQIYIQKLSNPLEEWSFDVEASDTIKAAISLVINAELPTQYSAEYIKLFFNSIELNSNSTFTNYNIQKFSHLTSTYTTKKHTFIGRTVQGKSILRTF